MKKLANKLFTKRYYFLRFDNMIVRHHLLECILWPNGDGTFRKIVNRVERLRELGIYDKFKMTIPIENGAHISMHHEFKKGTEYDRAGEKNPMYGIAAEKSPSWKGDDVGIPVAYKRANKLYKSGKITKEELQPYRDSLYEYQRQRKMAKKTSSDS